MSRPVKRSFSIRGHRTSISIESPFWEALKDAAREQRQSLAALVARIDAARGASGLSSAIRVWLLAYYRTRCDAVTRGPIDLGPIDPGPPDLGSGGEGR